MQSILELKLGSPIQMPRRRLAADLLESRRLCCVARNTAVMKWYSWRKAHADWKPGDVYAGSPRRIARKVKPQDAAKGPPKDPLYGPREFMSRALYQAAADAVPALSASVVSSCVQDVGVRLRANVPYDHDGKARWQWQAMLTAEVSVPTWRKGRIPLPRRCIALGYDGATWAGDGVGPRIKMELARAAESGAVVLFPLFGKASGRKFSSLIVRLDVKDLSVGRKRVLRQLTSGESRIADSQIVETNGKWFLQLCYELPQASQGCREDRILTIGPAQAADAWPFFSQWVEEDGARKTWFLGKAKPYVAELRRVQARRRAIRDRYTEGTGKGHGRQRWYRSIKPLARFVPNLQSRFVKQLCADIVQLALREKCGTVMYREPTMPVRMNCWFAKQDVPFDWTSLAARMAFSCKKAGLVFDLERIGMAEWRPKKSEAG